MSRSRSRGGSQLSFSTLSPFLPREIVNRILWYWIDQQAITVEESLQTSEDLVTYSCATDGLAESLPSSVRADYWRLRHLSWLSVSLKV